VAGFKKRKVFCRQFFKRIVRRKYLAGLKISAIGPGWFSKTLSAAPRILLPTGGAKD
jgi:hypothetical protein